MELNTIILIAILRFACITEATIKFVDNGYENILVVIQNDVADDPEILNTLKETFINASTFLNTSTRGLAHFRRIKVVVPSTWEDRGYVELGTPIPITSADIRIDEPTAKYGNLPFTLQPGSCSEPGKFIHLTPGFLAHKDNNSILGMYGDLGRLLVHEWAHFRYGVFDEYVDEETDLIRAFYIDEDDYKPTACHKNVSGWILSKDGGECFINNETMELQDCYFKPDTVRTDMTSSIMYLPYIPSVEHFCDSDVHRHNTKAPSKQNLHCDSLPTWKVISMHTDFQSTNKPTSETDIRPEFITYQLKRHSAPKTVILIDVSGSMNDPGLPRLSKIQSMDIAVRRYIGDIAEENSFVGIVGFSLSARTWSDMTKIDERGRLTLLGSLTTATYGGTGIGTGLLQALEILQRAYNETEGSYILLMTDGEENEIPYIKDVLPDLIDAGVIVNALAIGPQAQQTLSGLVTSTGGDLFYYNSDKGKNLCNVDNALRKTTNDQLDSDERFARVVHSSVSVENEYRKSVILDKQHGNLTKFEFSCLDSDLMEVSVTCPNGQIFNSSHKEYKYSKDTRTKSFTFDKAQYGVWNITVINKSNSIISVCVDVTTHKRKLKSKTITTDFWLSDLDVDLSVKNFIKVYGLVQYGDDPVINANVHVVITTPTGSQDTIKLYDNGAGADSVKDDGIYSAYFINFKANNRYSVLGHVSSRKDTRIIENLKFSGAPLIEKDLAPVGESSSSFAISDFRRKEFPKVKPTSSVKEIDVGPFQYVASASAFTVDNYVVNAADKLAPAKVNDLHITSSHTIDNGQTAVVKLEWTSVGDDMDVGNATSIDLRYSKSLQELLDHFNDSSRINQSNVIEGSLIPLPPHQKQKITIHLYNVSDHGLTASGIVITLNFGVRLGDEEGNLAKLSNLATTNILHRSSIPLYIATTTEEITTAYSSSVTSSTKSPETKNSEFLHMSKKTFFIIIAVLSVIFIILLITFVVLIYKYHKLKNKHISELREMELR
ncbi:Uncharacterised protein g2230 [Pycnogonum litorale]